MNVQTHLIMFALVAISGLVTVVAVEAFILAEKADAKGCPPPSPAFNASKGRCFRG